MTSQNIERLRRHFKDSNTLVVLVVDDNDESVEKTFTSFDEAKNEIELLENDNEIFF